MIDDEVPASADVAADSSAANGTPSSGASLVNRFPPPCIMGFNQKNKIRLVKNIKWAPEDEAHKWALAWHDGHARACNF